MSDAYVIEVHGNTVGIIVRQNLQEGYRFLSSLNACNSLEGQAFAGPLEAESAARKLLRRAPRGFARTTLAKF